MIDKDPVKTARRHMRRLEKFRTDKDVPCVRCGYGQPNIPKSVEWLSDRGFTLPPTEWHHPVGKAHDPGLIVPLCRNCHYEATEGLLQAGVSMQPTDNTVDQHATCLEGLASFFELLTIALRRWADNLRKVVHP